MSVCPGVYVIECAQAHQKYVGSGMNWKRRVQRHFQQLRDKKHPNILLQRDWDKYGSDSFKASLLESCNDYKQLQEAERKWLRQLWAHCRYNLYRGVPKGFYKHGLTQSPTYKSWDSMLQRCTNSNSPDFPRYGKVGITICESWLKFENFYADMGERPIGSSLDRYPNKNGNYEPDNCRWATASEQQKNKNNSIKLTHNGITKALVEWADEKQMPRDLLMKRHYAGMEGKELFAPSYSRYAGDEGAKKRKRKYVRVGMQRFEYQGKSLTIPELAVIAGISAAAALSQRLLRYKIPLEQAMLNVSLRRGTIGPRKGRNMLTAFGRTQSMTAWATEFKLPLSTLRNRILRAKMSPEDALSVSVAQQNQPQDK